MGSVKTWLTREEVLRGMSEGYVLIGDAPPPVRYEAEDEEMIEQFGDCIRTPGEITCSNQPPDLKGITNLLRMVQGSEDEDELHECGNGNTNPSDCVIAITKPSILNPNVEEFVPKSVKSNDSCNGISESSISAEKNDEIPVQTNGHQQCEELSHRSSSKCDCITDVENFSEMEKTLNNNFKLSVNNNKELVENLKTDASTSNSDFVSTRRKNVAIAALLKLYANKNIETPKNTQPLKLITPDFFENPIDTSNTKKGVPQPSPSTVTDEIGESITPSPNEVEKSNPVLEAEVVKKVTKVEIDDDQDIAMKISINKVNQWLNEPTREKKKPSLSLGPIAFKRKEPVTSKSSLSSEPVVQQTESNQPKQYQPSNYAADLGKKYMANKTNKEKQKINLWKDLHIILKEKDDMLMKKMQAQENMTSDSEDFQSSE